MMTQRPLSVCVVFACLVVSLPAPCVHAATADGPSARCRIACLNRCVPSGQAAVIKATYTCKLPGEGLNHEARAAWGNDFTYITATPIPTTLDENNGTAAWQFGPLINQETKTFEIVLSNGAGECTIVPFKMGTYVGDAPIEPEAVCRTGICTNQRCLVPACNTQSQKGKDPVDLGTGLFYMAGLTDLFVGGPIPLVFSRSYIPRLTDEGHVWSALGGNWMHNYDISLTEQQVDDPVLQDELPGLPLKAVNVVYLGGQLITFMEVPLPAGLPGEFSLANAEETVYQLQGEYALGGTGYWFMDPVRELLVLFDGDPGSADYGRPLEIHDRNGNKLALTHEDDGQGGRRLKQVQDDLNGQAYRTFALAYDANGNLQSVTDNTDQATPRQVQFGYARVPADTQEPLSYYQLTSFTDAENKQTTYAYSADPSHGPLMASYTLPENNTPVTNVFDAQGRVTQQTDAVNTVTTFEYGPDGGLAAGETRLTDPDGALVVTHTDEKLTTKIVDQAGNFIDFGYGRDEATPDLANADRPKQVQDRMAQRNTTSVDYHTPTGKPATITNADNKVISYTYTDQLQGVGQYALAFTFYDLTRVDYPDGTYVTYEYDVNGNVTKVTDQAAKDTTFTYNSYGQVLTVTNPTSGVVTYTYNANGTLNTVTDSDTGIGTTTYAYDAKLRLIKVTHPSTKFVQYTYDKNNRLTSFTDERNKTWTYHYDGNGNLVKAIDPDTYETDHVYDAMDRLLTVTDRENGVTTLTYDALGRIASVKDATNVTESYTYNSRGWLTGITQNGKTWQIAYDNEGVPTSLTTPATAAFPAGRTLTVTTNVLGYLTALTNHLNETTSLTRDAVSRVTKVTDARSQETNYTYDARGLLSQVSLPESISGVYTYNNAGLLSNIRDPDTKNWAFAYSNVGRAASHTDPLGKARNYLYDALGRLAEIRFPDHTEGDPDKAVFTYDDAHNLTQVTYSDGTILNYAYDNLSRLTSTNVNGTNTLTFTRDKLGRITNTNDAGVDFGATYDAAGRLATATYNDGALTVTYVYDNATGLLTGVSDSLSNASVTFTYNDEQQLTGITRGNGVNTTYTRDGAGRITRAQTGSIIDISYGHDAAGRLTQETLTTIPLDPADYLESANESITVNDADQVTSTGYTYDSRGRMLTGNGHTYTYNDAGHLVGISGEPVTMAYNGLGRLATRTQGGTTVRCAINCAVDVDCPAYERATDGSYRRYNVRRPGGALLYSVDPNTSNAVAYYHFDRTGSTLALTNAAGSVTNTYCYATDGRLLQRTGTDPQPYTFVGKWGVRQEGTDGQAYLMGDRFYDAKTGQFLTRCADWPTINDPRTINPYQYARGNPRGSIAPGGGKGTCVECVEDNHCEDRARPLCAANRCAEVECHADVKCPGGDVASNMKCVQVDPNAGTCPSITPPDAPVKWECGSLQTRRSTAGRCVPTCDGDNSDGLTQSRLNLACPGGQVCESGAGATGPRQVTVSRSSTPAVTAPHVGTRQAPAKLLAKCVPKWGGAWDATPGGAPSSPANTGALVEDTTRSAAAASSEGGETGGMRVVEGQLVEIDGRKFLKLRGSRCLIPYRGDPEKNLPSFILTAPSGSSYGKCVVPARGGRDFRE